MAPETFDTLTCSCRQAARAVYRLNRWLDFDDLLQEATASGLSAVETYRPEVGDLAPYIYRAAFRAAKRLAWRLAGAVSESARAPTFDGIARLRALTTPIVATPETECTDVSADEMIDAARRRAVVAEVVARHLAAGREGDAVRAVLFGEMPAREAAATFGLDVRVLYRATEKAKRHLRSDRRLMEVL